MAGDDDDGNRRTGPRLRQTMSGILGERRDARSNGAAGSAFPPSVIVDQQAQTDVPRTKSAPEGGRERNGR